jgi:type I restriction-modification system DNA methylase subunit
MVSHTESGRISISHQTSPGLGPLESRTDLSKQIIYEVPANDAAARLCHTESANQCNINVQQTGAGFGLGGCDDITRRDSKSDRLQVKQTFLAQPRILLGDAYEYLMRHFATESGKSKGQFYTPAEVSRVIAQVIGIRNAASTPRGTAL